VFWIPPPFLFPLPRPFLPLVLPSRAPVILSVGLLLPIVISYFKMGLEEVRKVCFRLHFDPLYRRCPLGVVLNREVWYVPCLSTAARRTLFFFPPPQHNPVKLGCVIEDAPPLTSFPLFFFSCCYLFFFFFFFSTIYFFLWWGRSFFFFLSSDDS